MYIPGLLMHQHDDAGPAHLSEVGRTVVVPRTGLSRAQSSAVAYCDRCETSTPVTGSPARP